MDLPINLWHHMYICKIRYGIQRETWLEIKSKIILTYIKKKWSKHIKDINIINTKRYYNNFIISIADNWDEFGSNSTFLISEISEKQYGYSNENAMKFSCGQSGP